MRKRRKIKKYRQHQESSVDDHRIHFGNFKFQANQNELETLAAQQYWSVATFDIKFKISIIPQKDGLLSVSVNKASF